MSFELVRYYQITISIFDEFRTNPVRPSDSDETSIYQNNYRIIATYYFWYYGRFFPVSRHDPVFPSDHPKLVIPNLGVFEITDAPLLFFFGDVIKAKICTYFDEMQLNHENNDLSKVGTPIAERTLEIDRIDNRLSDLVRQRDAIDSQISSLSA